MIAVDERMRRKSTEEYLASTAESERFLDYLTERNEQEAKTWIVKKWKKVCDFLRGVFKKYTGKELSSKDEMVLDALYRSAHLLGSDTYARFNYYRNLVREMGADGVEMGNVGEEMFRRETKRTVENGFGGIWIEDKQEYAKFVSAVNNYGFEEDGEGIAFTDNYFYAYYWNNEGDPIPFASVYLNSENSQDVVNQVNKEIKDVRKGQRVKKYFDTAVARYEVLQSQDNANDGDNRSISNRRGNVRLGNRLLQKGKYYDSPNLYVKTQRADWFGQPINEGTIIFSKGKPAGYVNLSSEMFKGKRNVLSVLEAKDTAILNASKKWFESVLGEGRLVTDNHKSASVYAQASKNYSSMKKSSLLRS